jgi:hypothetical protein
MLHLLSDYNWKYPGELPGVDKLKETLKQILIDLKK